MRDLVVSSVDVSLDTWNRKEILKLTFLCGSKSVFVYYGMNREEDERFLMIISELSKTNISPSDYRGISVGSMAGVLIDYESNFRVPISVLYAIEGKRRVPVRFRFKRERNIVHNEIREDLIRYEI